MAKHYPEAFVGSKYSQIENLKHALRLFVHPTFQEKDNPHNYRSNSKSLIFMRKITLTFLFLFVFCSAFVVAQTKLIVTGVMDGPLSGGVPKTIELYVLEDITDLSQYGIGSANNGGGTDGEEFTLSGSATAGQFIYIASESKGFNSFFGFDPDFTDSAANINGDDAIELFFKGNVVDVFGDINVDGTNQPWEYLDGWAYRVDETGPDGSTFMISNWTFSGSNSLDGESTNAAAVSPFPIGSYTITLNLAPEITNNDGEAFVVNFDENFDFSETVITDINATDDTDLEANDDVSLRLTYSLSTENGGGADNDLFSVASISGGVLPLPLDRVFDFENPMDANGDNNYEIQVTVTDSDGNTDFIDVTLTINDVDETPPVVQDVLISEFQPNPTGSDPANVTVELSGPAGESFSGWLLSIESDPGTSAGLVDRATEVSGTFDSNGLLLVSIPDFENPSFTVALMDTFTGTTSTDIDADNDGVADDLSTFGTVYDAIGIPDTTGEPLYGTDLGGLDFAYTGDEPRLVFRDASVGDWYAINDPDAGEVYDITGTDVTPAIFDTDPTDGTDTFGVVNPSVTGTPANVIGITITDAVKSEGNSGTTTFTFTVTRSGDVSQATSVQYTTSGDVDDADFPGSLPSGTVNFAANDAEEIIEILVNGDTDAESNETFTLTLSNAANGENLDPISAQGIIQDDDIPVGAPTLISAIQGSGSSVAITTEVIVEAIVVGDFQESDQLSGFFVQEEDADSDSDPNTSEGIFVYCNTCPVDVAVGDLVQVTGLPEDFFDMSQLDVSAATNGSVTIISSGNALPTPASINLPASGNTAAVNTFENVEGMLVNFTDNLFVSEYFELARYGQLVLTADGRPRQFTDFNTPDASGFAAYEADLASRQIILDDDNNIQNAPISGAGDIPYFWPRPGLQNSNLIRGGDKINDLTGIMHWSFAGENDTNAWRVRPVEPAFTYNFISNNPRSNSPTDVGGSLKVASFNVLNYFTTLDSRGADSSAELDRQRQKIAEAICVMNADVIGLIEIENNGSTALDDLLNGTNGVNSICTDTYMAVNTGVIGTDEIAVAFIYNSATISLQGPHAILDSAIDSRFNDDKNRPALAQTFVEISSGEKFTAVVNHLKSKGSDCGDVGDPDPNPDDGTASCNQTRADAAAAMVDWLATDPTGSGDPDILILGDLNSYRMEDPITNIKVGADDTASTTDDYTDLLDNLIGANAYSFVFDGKVGYLDYALANSGLFAQVTGVTSWHTNADEINIFDYNDGIQDSGEQPLERKSNALPV